ncbi:uncharacterized protein [Glycine max]|uniref:uncharacterized protein n=1 Tax=Glycine max TaxID=3847 RepID=UPI0003DED32B|nr:uncharacterized protein LOC102666732 [Glycine max]|eukprot:XP_006586496.1 uncharacterized protein LOC102666732 [Glycine max]
MKKNLYGPILQWACDLPLCLSSPNYSPINFFGLDSWQHKLKIPVKIPFIHCFYIIWMDRDLSLPPNLLIHKNYTTWSNAMMVALSVKNKVAFIDGSVPMPTIADPTYAAWTRGNNVVISRLYNFVSKDIITNILFANTTKEIWDDLKTRFSRKNGPRIFQLRRQLMSLQQGNDDVSTYYTKLKSVWEELLGYKPTFQCKCGGLQTLQVYNESEYVMSFLMGLNDSFAQIQGQILLSDPLPPIGNVFSLVI